MSKKIRPRTRPKVTSGVTIKQRVACGSIYVTINEDKEGIVEIFVKLGMSGGCAASQTEAIARLASLAFRAGIEPDEVIRELKGIRCPNTIWSEGVPIMSCADAIAKALQAYIDKDFSVIRLGPVTGEESEIKDGTQRLDEFTTAAQAP